MVVNNVGYDFRHGSDFKINRPMGSGDYALIMTKSKAVFTLENGDTHTLPGTVMVYKKGSPQIFGADGEVFVNDWVHFDFDKADDGAAIGSIPFNCPFVLDDTTALSALFAQMSREMYSSGNRRKEIAELYLKILLCKLDELSRRPAKGAVTPYFERLSEIRAQVYNTPSRYRTISDAAESAHISASYFQHLYKEQFGRSFISDVIASRMERAKYLLTHTEYRVNGIAYELGYAAEEQFMRQFKREVGMTPSDYRKRYGISAVVLERCRTAAPYSVENAK